MTMNNNVVIIDYEMCNLGSVKRSFEECGAKATVTSEPKDLESATHVVLPGVGAFTSGMQNIKSGGWYDPICKVVLDQKIPLLGICLGMQLLADKGYEGAETEGLGLIPGEVKVLEPRSKEERIPHMGWNEVYRNREHALLEGIPEGADFYFVHSYHFVPKNNENALAKTPYCGDFICSVESKNIMGVQFHPEKSSRFGMQLIKNFLKIYA